MHLCLCKTNRVLLVLQLAKNKYKTGNVRCNCTQWKLTVGIISAQCNQRWWNRGMGLETETLTAELYEVVGGVCTVHMGWSLPASCELFLFLFIFCYISKSISSAHTSTIHTDLVPRGQDPHWVEDPWLGTFLTGDDCPAMLGSKQFWFFLLLLQSIWHEEVDIRSSLLVFVGMLCSRSVGIICVFAQELIQGQVMVTYFIQESTTHGITILLSDEFKTGSMLLR